MARRPIRRSGASARTRRSPRPRPSSPARAIRTGGPGRPPRHHASALSRPALAPGIVVSGGRHGDFFTHFSCVLDVGTPDNAARALGLYQAFVKEAAQEDVPPDGFLLSV